MLDAASIDTKFKRRDEHLRGRGFLDVGTYPTLKFTVTEATLSQWTVGGPLVSSSLDPVEAERRLLYSESSVAGRPVRSAQMARSLAAPDASSTTTAAAGRTSVTSPTA